MARIPTNSTKEDRRRFVLTFLRRATNGMASTNFIGHRMKRAGVIAAGVRCRGNYVLAAESVMRPLEKLGLVRQFRSGRDEWSVKMWALTKNGKAMADEITIEDSLLA